jgi:signal transduction histidine kinase
MIDAPTREDAIASLAHELKNPLAAVRALVQLLVASEVDARTKVRLDVVYTEVLRMEAILREHLSPQRLPLELRPFDLGSLADDVVTVLEGRALAAGVEIERRPTTATVTGDAPRLKAALLNLVGNAIEATPPGGRVELTVREVDGRVHVEIRDTGKGIASQHLARLGTPFFSMRDGGTGLGVMLARAAVAEHGGSLEYESQIGVGTLARVTLPVRSRPC